MMEESLMNSSSQNDQGLDLTPMMKRRIEWMVIGFLTLAFVVAGVAQNDTDPLKELNYQAQSEFQPSIKDAIKFSDLPEIKDTVQRIRNVQYGISSYPVYPKYQVQPVEAAKLQNEPLDKLYHSLLKVGYAPVYAMPLGEFYISNQRSKNQSYGAMLKHFSSRAQLKDVGYSGFSDNIARVYGKRLYKRHTLSGDLGFMQNEFHYYGFDTSVTPMDDRDFIRQRYRLIDPSVRLQSHYTDSTHINHNVSLGFHNLTNLDHEAENNVKAKGLGEIFLNKEKLNLELLADFYNHKQYHDTLNNLIVSLNPSFEAGGKKWRANVGLGATLDNFREKTVFHVYPNISVQYDIYESMVIPYAGASGGLIKNSMRSLTTENPFVDSTINYQNTNNVYNLYGGLRGKISSNVSYDARASYGQFDNLHYYAINYTDANPLDNRFEVIYDNTSILNVSGQINYQAAEKLNFIAKGNYYHYQPKTFIRPYHRPDFDMTLSGIYNLKSKIIVRGDLFIMGKQFAKWPPVPNTISALQPEIIPAWGDLNLEVEYRYTKMLSFFARFNNIANQRYFRWDRYPRQRFNFMVGLTFVPF